jgi:hypothetical protein
VERGNYGRTPWSSPLMACSILLQDRLLPWYLWDWEGKEEHLQEPPVITTQGACFILLLGSILALEPGVGLGGKGGTSAEAPAWL